MQMRFQLNTYARLCPLSACSLLHRLLALHEHTQSRQPQPPPHPRSPVDFSANSALWAAIQNRPRQGSSTGLLVIRLRRSHAASWAPVWGCSMWMAPSVQATARACKARACQIVQPSAAACPLLGWEPVYSPSGWWMVSFVPPPGTELINHIGVCSTLQHRASILGGSRLGEIAQLDGNSKGQAAMSLAAPCC